MGLLKFRFPPVQLTESMERLRSYADDSSCSKIVVLQATKRQGAIKMTLFRIYRMLISTLSPNVLAMKQ